MRRAFAGVDLGPGPVLHMDQMGEVEYAPGESSGTPVAASRPSPTASTGVFRHQDSNGSGGLITDGDMRW